VFVGLYWGTELSVVHRIFLENLIFLPRAEVVYDACCGVLLSSKLSEWWLLSRTWRDRLLGASAGATLTLVALWLVLVSAAAAAVIRHA